MVAARPSPPSPGEPPEVKTHLAGAARAAVTRARESQPSRAAVEIRAPPPRAVGLRARAIFPSRAGVAFFAHAGFHEPAPFQFRRTRLAPAGAAAKRNHPARTRIQNQGRVLARAAREKKRFGPRRRRPDHAGFNQSRTGSVGGENGSVGGRRACADETARIRTGTRFWWGPRGEKKKKNLIRSPRAAAPEETRNGRRELVSNRRVASVRSGRRWERSAPCVRRGVEMG